MVKHSEFIQGLCQQVLFSPKGSVEGVLVKVKGLVCQIAVSPEVGEVLAHDTRPGKHLRMLAVLDPSSMTGEGAHPVYEFTSFANSQGKALALPGADPSHTTVKGTVAALHYARHGEPNGVMLLSGEFIHLRPHGMAKLKLGVGSWVTAVGSAHTTRLGTPMLEAHKVNRIEIE